MAFNKRLFDPTASGSKGTKVIGLYQTDDAKATVKGAGYFNSVNNELERTAVLLIIASDATFFAKVTVVAGVVTLAAPETFA